VECEVYEGWVDRWEEGEGKGRVYRFVESLKASACSLLRATLLSQRLNARRERVLSSRAEGRMKVRVGKGF
jgi:hypothetical protein